MPRRAARRSLAACACGLLALSGAVVEGRMPSGPFVTSINGLGVSVNNWPTSDESVSAMMFHSLADVDPLVRLQRLRLRCGMRASAASATNVHRPPKRSRVFNLAR